MDSRQRQAYSEEKEQGVIRNAVSSYLGTACVDLDALLFPQSAFRRLRPKNVARLVRIFKTQGCLRSHPDHHIKATISRERLNEALRYSDQTAADRLLSTTDYPELWLAPGTLACLFGLHRIEAAKQYLEYPSRWWTVKLYEEGQSCTAAGRLDLTNI